ncbi:MAG TPA: S9 family peptidase [Caulobacteraceae bacterium]|nr:S9 family peptidase [Caulobacteraceae bacterium]
MTALIERSRLFGNPSRAAGQISPDGAWLSWLAPSAGVMNVWVAPTEDPAAARAVTTETQRPIRAYFWAPDSSRLLYINDQGGDENFKLFAVAPRGNASAVLTPFDGVQTQILKVSTKVTDRILIGLNNRDARWHDVHALDLASGELKLVFENDGFGGFLIDQDLVVRAGSKPRADGGEDLFEIKGAVAASDPFDRLAFEDADTTRPLRYSADGRTLYWIDGRGRNTSALIAQDAATGAKTVLAEDARVDIADALFNPMTGVAEAYPVNYLKTEWVALDAAVAGDLAFLERELDGDIAIQSRTRADDRWIVGVDPVTGPPAAYLYERAAKRLTKLYVTRPDLESAPLAPMHAVEIRTRDSLVQVSYLTLPVDADPNGTGRPRAPVPMVLLPHGGPWGRDLYGYNPLHQLLANRGYAVLSPNFRGSTGFGKAFLAAGNLEWGAKMHDDLIDAVDWAIAEGITTKDQVAIMGGSYGGYCVLAGLAFTPETFACGVDIVGPSNLNTLLSSIPAYWEAGKIQMFLRVGDPTTPDGQALLKERSPLTRADDIVRPLLIAQGANDPRVKQAESDQIVQAMQAKSIPVTYVLFPDEGHGFARPENMIAFVAVAEQFLAANLGGRAEPYGEALAASTIQVPAGVDGPPGLEAALVA